ncbi:MAG: class I SAM-dependent methyltransferase [bacterium]
MGNKTIRKLAKIVYNVMLKTSLGRIIEEEFEMFAYSGTGPRHFEYPFAISEVMERNKKKRIANILDAGSYGSLLPLILASLGFEVTGVDRNYWNVKFPGFLPARADLKKLPFKSNFFDCVTAVSTIEHVGLPRFRETIDTEGDFKAVRELVRVLKRDGCFIFTAPYASVYSVWSNKNRVYDKDRLSFLFKDLKIIKKQYFGPIGGNHNFGPWTEKKANVEKLERVGDHCVVCVVAKKI